VERDCVRIPFQSSGRIRMLSLSVKTGSADRKGIGEHIAQLVHRAAVTELAGEVADGRPGDLDISGECVTRKGHSPDCPTRNFECNS
jgi:hypothetical protein